MNFLSIALGSMSEFSNHIRDTNINRNMEGLSEYTEESIEKRNLNNALFIHNTKSRQFLIHNISLTKCS